MKEVGFPWREIVKNSDSNFHNTTRICLDRLDINSSEYVIVWRLEDLLQSLDISNIRPSHVLQMRRPKLALSTASVVELVIAVNWA